MKRALPYLAVAAVFGCSGATTSFTRTGPTLAAQPDGCEFAIVATSPSTPSTELGTIDIKYAKQTDWIYDESAFRRKVRTQVCQSGGDTVVANVNDNGLYMSATVLTSKVAPVTPASTPAPSEPEATAQVAEPVTAPSSTASAPASAPDKSAQAAAKPGKKEDGAKDDEPAKALNSKKPSKKGASAKKEEDKDGKIDIDSLL